MSRHAGRRLDESLRYSHLDEHDSNRHATARRANHDAYLSASSRVRFEDDVRSYRFDPESRSRDEGRSEYDDHIEDQNDAEAPSDNYDSFYNSRGPVNNDMSEKHQYTAGAAIDDILAMFEKRMRSSERAATALLEARQSVDLETILKRGSAEAEAWSHGTGRLSAVRASHNLSPLQVRAVVAERDELRYQLRKAAAELRKVEAAAGGNHMDLVSQYQHDMDRLVRLKAQVNLELEQADIRNSALQDEVRELRGFINTLELQVDTMQEQLGERSETIVELQHEVDRLQELLRSSKREAEQRRQESLDQLRDDLARQHSQAMDDALTQMESKHRSEISQKMEKERQNLEQRYSQLLDTKLREQREALLKQAAENAEEERQRLVRDMQAEHRAAMDELQQDMARQAARDLEHAKQRHLAVQSRLESQIEALEDKHRADLARAIEENRSILMTDTQAKIRAAVDKREDELTQRHRAEVAELREALESKHDEMSRRQGQTQLDRIKKNALAQSKREQRVAIENLKKDLEENHRQELAQAKQQARDLAQREFDAQMEKTLAQETKRLEAKMARQRALELEQTLADFRREKTASLQQLRERLQQQYSDEIEDLKRRLQEAESENRDLNIRVHQLTADNEQKRTVQAHLREAIRDRFRSVLALIKSAHSLASEKLDHAFDQESATQLGSLLDAIARDNYTLLNPPSMLASNTPPHGVDMLLTCIEELNHMLTVAIRQVDHWQKEVAYAKVLARKQAEDDVALDHRQELQAIRVELESQRDEELDRRAREIQHIYEEELRRERKIMDEEVQRAKSQAANQTRHLSQALKHKAAQSERRVQSGTSKASAAKEAAEAAHAMERMQREHQRELTTLHRNLEELRDQNSHLRDELRKRPSGGPSTSRTVQSLQSEVGQLRQELAQGELERLRLEKTIDALQSSASPSP